MKWFDYKLTKVIHGENLFKIIQSQLNTQRDKLYSLFLSGLDEHFTDTETSKSIYTDLWGKMNLRKEEWRESRERLLTQRGKNINN